MSKPAIVTVILAAGNSGRLGMHKALIRFGNKCAIRAAVETSLASRAERTIVVLGAEAEAVGREIADLPCSVVENVKFSLGRTGSIKCALRSIDKLPETAVLIFPVDCPLVPSKILNQLIEAFTTLEAVPVPVPGQPRSESVWIAPEHKGKHGHPVLLFGPILAEILKAGDDFPLRDLLHAAEADGRLRHITVGVDSEAVLDNIDTVEDFKRVLEREALT